MELKNDQTFDISIILPVLNGMKFIERSLHSILLQTFQRWELIAFDDGSEDDSYGLLCHFQALEPRIRPFRLAQNRGPSAARNFALRQTKGSFVTYLDCDDEYFADYLHHVDACRHAGDVLVFCYDAIDDGQGLFTLGEIRTWDPALVRPFLMEQNIANPLGVARRRDLLEAAGPFDERWYVLEDWELWQRFARAGAEFIFLPLKSGLYHLRPDSQSRSRRVPEALRELPTLREPFQSP